MTTPILDNPSLPVAEGERPQPPRGPLIPLETSRTDAVADHFRAAGREPNYDEIAAMVKPYKYVNATFRVYPLVLGEKEGAEKIRLVADGSQLHLGVTREQDKDKQRHAGLDRAVDFYGPAFSAVFRTGEALQVVDAHPLWRKGWQPVAQYRWTAGGVRYTLEVFGALLPATSRLCAWVRVGLTRLRPEAKAQWGLQLQGETPLQADGRVLFHTPSLDVRAGLSPEWTFDPERQLLLWSLPAGVKQGTAQMVFADQPVKEDLLDWPSSAPRWAIDAELTRREAGGWLVDWCAPERFELRLNDYLSGWERDFTAAARVSVPEARVQKAQQGVRAGGFVLTNRDQVLYSVGNPYERMYTDESGYAAMTLGYWGHLAEARRYLEHLAFYNQRGIATHDLGARLHLFCRYHELSGDDGFLARNLPRMRRWCEWLINDLREEHHGLGAPNKHCGDLDHQVFSTSANCLAWRGMRDFGVLTGDEAILERAARYREDIRRAAEASLDKRVDPPFLPMALYGNEPTPDFLMESMVASYWCLVAPYALYGGALGDDHPGTRAMLETFERRGGLCGGLVRWTNPSDKARTILRECGLDDLYGTKLVDVWARRDEPEQLVLSLYGKLALGLTPDTLIGGEGSSLAPTAIFGEKGGQDGRSLYFPPNSASQLFFARIVRNCLVFDFDSRDDGRCDTLRLAFSTPRRWLEDGKRIEARRMPTAFGPVSYRIVSKIKSGVIEAEVTLPERSTPAHCRLRLRAPGRPALRSVTVNGAPHAAFDPAREEINLSGLRGRVVIRAIY
jgi:hypothetical protein